MNPMARVETEIRARGETLASFAARIGVRSQDINNWKHRGIPRTKQRCVAEALGWSLDRLLTGEPAAPARADQPQTDQPSSHSMSTAGTGSTHAYPDAAGFKALETRDGEPSDYSPWLPKHRLNLRDGRVVMIAEGRSPVAFPPDWLERRGLREETLALYQAEGDGMAPLIRDGDILLVDLADTRAVDGGLFLLHDGRMLIIRRVYFDYDGTWILRSDNFARYPDQTVPPVVQETQVKVVGRVHWRGGEIGE